MSNNEVKFREFILDSVSTDSAHNLGHIERVVQNAKRYTAMEHANLDIVIPAAWLHDCVTISKGSPDRACASTMAAVKARDFLLSINYDKSHVEQIGHAIEAHSYSANIEATTTEAKIVQDADRIDALGAIGISRCLLVGGSLNRTLYSTVDPFCVVRTPDDENFCIDHFFKKLFNIADTLQTNAAKIDAVKRVKFMKNYLAELNAEITS